VDEFFGREHLRNDHVANDVENVVGHFVFVLDIIEEVELFDVENVFVGHGLDDFAGLVCTGFVFQSAVRHLLHEFFLDGDGVVLRFIIPSGFGLLSYHFFICLFKGSRDGDLLARLQNVVGDEAQVFCDDDESKLDGRQFGAVFLHITVEDLEEFAVDKVEILANDDADFVLFYRDNVDDLLNDVVPDEFGVAAEQGHVDFVVYVADVVLVVVFFCLELYFFIVLQ
jgi:hypothetical protein